MLRRYRVILTLNNRVAKEYWNFLLTRCADKHIIITRTQVVIRSYVGRVFVGGK